VLNSLNNGDFEAGSWTDWVVGGGSRTTVASSLIQISDYLPNGSLYDSAVANMHTSVVSRSQDPTLGHLMPNIVHSGDYSLRIGDLLPGVTAAIVTRIIDNYFCPDLYFVWLAVLENAGHDMDSSASMAIQLNDLTDGDTLLMRRHTPTASNPDPRFQASGSIFYTPSWQTERISINSTRRGHRFALSILAADCKGSAHQGRVYLDSVGSTVP
jgi:hypothetical protein